MMKRFTTVGVAMLALSMLAACSAVRQNAEAGRKTARLVFAAPELAPRVTPTNYVSIITERETDDDCAHDELGGIRIPFGVVETVEQIPAGKRADIRVRNADDDGNQARDIRFSFVPEAGREYIIKPEHDGHGLKLHYYVLDDDGLRTEFKVDEAGVCE